MTDAQPHEEYRRAIEFLYDLKWFGARPGLENTFRLARLSGNPQHRLRFIHVAGTNGKGSTCAMLESIYRASGLRVGLFTSPHLVSFRERIQVNRRLIGEDELVRLVNELRPLLKGLPADEHPTLFEVATVMALRYFAEQKCDLIIWETGLGGRLDATNVVTPLASVITNVQFDHQKWLGETLALIAVEKAGIIKPGVPAITTADEAEAIQVIETAARERNAPLTRVAATFNLPALPLPGSHQQRNAALALATIEVLQHRFPVSEAMKRSGLESVNWPGRMQWVNVPDGRKILLDGAHNVAGAEALAAALKAESTAAPFTLVLGILDDKDQQGICGVLAPLAQKILLVPVSSERTASPEALAAACQRANGAAPVVVRASLREALSEAARTPFLVITGSLYLIGEAMELLGLSPDASPAERGLNEWSGGGRIVESLKTP